MIENLIGAADAVLFQGDSLGELTPNVLRKLTKQKKLDQKMDILLLLSLHSKRKRHNYLTKYDGIFNWIMTYNPSSDILSPYYEYQTLSPNEKAPPATINYADGKDKFAFWFWSNCGVGFPWRAMQKETKKNTFPLLLEENALKEFLMKLSVAGIILLPAQNSKTVTSLC